MDAHKVLREVFNYFGIYEVPANIIYTTLGFFVFIIYYFSSSEEKNLIKWMSLKKKSKDMEALTAQLCVTLEKLEERTDVFQKQATFRLDMQSVEQKEVRLILAKLNEAIQQFYESD